MKLELVPKFCYLGDTLGVGGGVEEAARARMRSLICAWAKFKELFPIPVVPNLWPLGQKWPTRPQKVAGP